MKRIEYTPTGRPIKTLMGLIDRGEMIFNEEYQRKFIWKPYMQEQLIETIFLNMPIGSAIMWENATHKEIVDGLQRLSTIRAYMNDEFSLPTSISREIVQRHIDFLRRENTKESRNYLAKFESEASLKMKYSTLPLTLKDMFDTYQMSIIEIRNCTVDEIRNYFIKVQNQEKLKGGEIISSLPDSELVYRLNKFDIESFSKKINFNDVRKEIIKMLAMFHGISTNKVALNASESKIISYSTKNTKINEIFFKRLNDLFKDVFASTSEMNVKTKAHIKLLFISRLLTNKLEGIQIENLVKATEKFVDDSKILSSNDPSKASIRQLFISKYPEKYQASMILKGQHSSKALEEIIPTFVSLLTSMSKKID